MIFILPAACRFVERCALFAALKFIFQHFHNETSPIFRAGNLVDSNRNPLGNRNHRVTTPETYSKAAVNSPVCLSTFNRAFSAPNCASWKSIHFSSSV
jgi:hypothetical protein